MNKIDELKTEYERLMRKLKTERDELQLKAHLASLELQQEWRQTEQSWEKFKFKVSRLGKEAEHSADEIGEVLNLLGQELKDSYKRFKKIF